MDAAVADVDRKVAGINRRPRAIQELTPATSERLPASATTTSSIKTQAQALIRSGHSAALRHDRSVVINSRLRIEDGSHGGGEPGRCDRRLASRGKSSKWKRVRSRSNRLAPRVDPRSPISNPACLARSLALAREQRASGEPTARTASPKSCLNADDATDRSTDR